MKMDDWISNPRNGNKLTKRRFSNFISIIIELLENSIHVSSKIILIYDENQEMEIKQIS